MIADAEFAECRDCLCMKARKEAARLTRTFDDHLRPTGLTINQFSLLSTLILAGPLPMTALAARLGIDRTTLTRNVGLSRSVGFVREARAGDARMRLIEITPAGRAAAEEALSAWREAQRRAALA